MVKGKIQPKAQTTKKGQATSAKGNVLNGHTFSTADSSSAGSKMIKNAGSSISPGSPSMCSGCGTYVTKDMKALQCDLCQADDTWQCVDLSLIHISEPTRPY